MKSHGLNMEYNVQKYLGMPSPPCFWNEKV